ncbi:MAG TPA: Rieske 2Fe-2S domain-containing protein [Lunatimonas sp.]|nr:Rieske 2Fe-2S domain-containing protein [Lunatimonas sp.]
MSKKFVLGSSEAGARELFPEKKIRQVQLGETKICVVRIGDDFFAFEALCPHRLASLSEGAVTGFGEVVCPLHQYRFDVKTGAIKSGDCRDLRCYPAEITSSGLVITA